MIDSNGFQKAYVGPYRLQGKDYSNQDWFHEVIIRSAYVSDVFMGYRKLPHFAIAVKRESPEKGRGAEERAQLSGRLRGRHGAAGRHRLSVALDT